jgi:hypothetical protein
LIRNARDPKQTIERKSHRELGLHLALAPGVVVIAERSVRLVRLAADELGLLGV